MQIAEEQQPEEQEAPHSECRLYQNSILPPTNNLVFENANSDRRVVNMSIGVHLADTAARTVSGS